MTSILAIATEEGTKASVALKKSVSNVKIKALEKWQERSFFQNDPIPTLDCLCFEYPTGIIVLGVLELLGAIFMALLEVLFAYLPDPNDLFYHYRTFRWDDAATGQLTGTPSHIYCTVKVIHFLGLPFLSGLFLIIGGTTYNGPCAFIAFILQLTQGAVSFSVAVLLFYYATPPEDNYHIIQGSFVLVTVFTRVFLAHFVLEFYHLREKIKEVRARRERPSGDSVENEWVFHHKPKIHSSTDSGNSYGSAGSDRRLRFGDEVEGELGSSEEGRGKRWKKTKNVLLLSTSSVAKDKDKKGGIWS